MLDGYMFDTILTCAKINFLDMLYKCIRTKN